MPSLGMAMDEGQVVKWHVAPGETVNAGQTLLEIESEKTTAEIDTPVAGVVGDLLVEAGATVLVDTVLVRIGTDAEDAQGASTPAPAALDSAKAPAQADGTATAPPPGERASASPRARKLADELGVDWRLITGTGPGGSIVEADIRGAAESAPADDYVLRALSPVRRRTAERTAESARTAPHFFISNDIDADALADCHAAMKTRGGKIGPTLNDIVLWAVARTLPAHPGLNAAYFEDGVHEWKDVGLGFVTAVDDGLLVPVIAKAATLSFSELVGKRASLVERARSGKLQPDDMAGGTFTVSNLGGFGVQRFNSILNRGQSGILSVGAMGRRPTITGDAVGVGSFMSLTLTVDHRCVDGVGAARFLSDLGALLEAIRIEDLDAR